MIAATSRSSVGLSHCRVSTSEWPRPDFGSRSRRRDSTMASASGPSLGNWETAKLKSARMRASDRVDALVEFVRPPLASAPTAVSRSATTRARLQLPSGRRTVILRSALRPPRAPGRRFRVQFPARETDEFLHVSVHVFNYRPSCDALLESLRADDLWLGRAQQMLEALGQQRVFAQEDL